MSNLVVRSISGFAFISILISSIYFSNAYYLPFVLGIFSILGLYEFAQLLKVKNIQLARVPYLLIGLSLFVLLLPQSLKLNIESKFVALVFLLIVFWAIEIWRKQENPLQTVAYGTFGLMYCVLPFATMVWVNYFGEFFEITNNNLLYMFILVWTNDTFAYLSGRAFGKHKLFERISPKKTWEGTIGGILATIIAGLIIMRITLAYTWLEWVIGAILVAIAAIIGDLFESLIKRSLGVKDSGNIIPGHGGVLDRFDASMFAAPVYMIWFYFYSLFL